jgi:GH24 family phage-related lysozyme (muramidase)
MAESFMSDLIPEEESPTILGQNKKMGTKRKEDITEEDMPVFIEHLKRLEGLKLTAYKPNPGEEYWTIGYGRYGADVKKGMTITEQQADEYLREDIEKRLVKIKRVIPNFENMPIDAKKHILDSWFRGGLSGSPKAIKLINENKYKEASIEFLKNDEYLNSKTQAGVKKRMKATSEAIASLGKTYLVQKDRR